MTCDLSGLAQKWASGLLCTSDFTITSAFQNVPEVPIFQPLHLHPPNNLFHLSVAMQAAQGHWTPGLAWSGQKIYLNPFNCVNASNILEIQGLWQESKFFASIGRENYLNLTNVSRPRSAITSCSDHVYWSFSINKKFRIWVTLIKVLVLED